MSPLSLDDYYLNAAAGPPASDSAEADFARWFQVDYDNASSSSSPSFDTTSPTVLSASHNWTYSGAEEPPSCSPAAFMTSVDLYYPEDASVVTSTNSFQTQDPLFFVSSPSPPPDFLFAHAPTYHTAYNDCPLTSHGTYPSDVDFGIKSQDVIDHAIAESREIFANLTLEPEIQLQYPNSPEQSAEPVEDADADLDIDAEGETEVEDNDDSEYFPSPVQVPRTLSSRPRALATRRDRTSRRQRPAPYLRPSASSGLPRMSPPGPRSRNKLLETDAVAEYQRTAPTMPADGRCPECEYIQHSLRPADFTRHFATHLPKDMPLFVCGGLPIARALEQKVNVAEWEAHHYNGYDLVGGCWKSFSRKDAYQRHMKHLKHIGDAKGPWLAGNFGREEPPKVTARTNKPRKSRR